MKLRFLFTYHTFHHKSEDMNLDLNNFWGHLDKDNDNESLFNDVNIDDQEDFLNQTGLPEEELDLPILKIPESASWKSFLNNFKSANYYNKVIYDFFHWKQNNLLSRDPTIEANIPNKLFEYFDLLHELPNETGTILSNIISCYVFSFSTVLQI